MNIKTVNILAAGVVATAMLTGTAEAADVLCKTITNNHMLISDTQVSACLDAGIGNLTGNPANDLFLNGAGSGLGYEPIAGGSFTQSNGTGTFSLDASLWDTFATIAIGFKFGTGNQPDEWFVYQLISGITSGNWTFVNVFDQGGGLSHIQLYGIRDGGDGGDGEDGGTELPEPATLALFGLGMLMLGLVRRRRDV